jgi:hypothetical protein
MTAVFEYRLIYNDEIDPIFMCQCNVFSPCEPCILRDNDSSNWIHLPLYNLSRFNKYIPEHTVLFPEDIEELMDKLHKTDESDEDFHDKMEAFGLFEELYYKSDGYIVEIHYE